MPLDDDASKPRPTYLSYEAVIEKDVKGGRVGKKKVKSEDELKDMVLPAANDVIGIAKKCLVSIEF